MMGHSKLTEGKANSIAQSGGGAQTEPPQRCGSAPMFGRPGEPEPNCVVGERLQEPSPRPRRAPTRTRAEARKLGLAHAEALDLTREEVLAYEA
jgi:hypothetical protein